MNLKSIFIIFLIILFSSPLEVFDNYCTKTSYNLEADFQYIDNDAVVCDDQSANIFHKIAAGNNFYWYKRQMLSSMSSLSYFIHPYFFKVYKASNSLWANENMVNCLIKDCGGLLCALAMGLFARNKNVTINNVSKFTNPLTLNTYFKNKGAYKPNTSQIDFTKVVSLFQITAFDEWYTKTDDNLNNKICKTDVNDPNRCVDGSINWVSVNKDFILNTLIDWVSQKKIVLLQKNVLSYLVYPWILAIGHFTNNLTGEKNLISLDTVINDYIYNSKIKRVIVITP